MLVSAAHDQDTPAVSPVRRRRASWGRNCGTARIAATRGSKPNTTCIGDPSVARVEALAATVYGGIGRRFVRISAAQAPSVKNSMRVDAIDRRILAELP